MQIYYQRVWRKGAVIRKTAWSSRVFVGGENTLMIFSNCPDWIHYLVTKGLPLRGFHGRDQLSEAIKKTPTLTTLGACCACQRKACAEAPTGPLTIILSVSWHLNGGGMRGERVTNHSNITWQVKNPKSQIWTPTRFWCHRFWLMPLVLKALLRHAVHSKQLSTPRSNRFTL